MIDWQDLHHSDLSVSQLYALLQLRCAVFVVEQNCPYQDIDGDDLQDIDGDDLEGENRHILGWREKIATFSVGITGHWWRMRGF